ncbi:hypothetical protein O7626_34860 [Micromonospora sp. WMMD1102]|uniref:hypothetical protein n=1 Tax=Micromonospora sp. WMMD1102 TaxID=3016105 RepID=UPI0024158AA5|nr:hypothetical protein [Micromonospora sp. WMMD1102]MDG4791030.1 hypothetical protein [Micromonospora sp. WMMD1102]
MSVDGGAASAGLAGSSAAAPSRAVPIAIFLLSGVVVGSIEPPGAGVGLPITLHPGHRCGQYLPNKLVAM